MARKVIIDCDPGIGDAVALCLALFDPHLEVVALTATEGRVTAEQASRNVQALVEHLDPPRLARVGSASPSVGPPLSESPRLHGADGLGNVDLAVSELHRPHPAEKIICDAIRSAPDEVSLITLGPLTNIARAFQRDPTVVEMVDRIIICGGSINGIGDVTPVAEFNMYYDPESARTVFCSPTTKTVVPLDVSGEVLFSLAMVEELPPETTPAGALLHRIIPFAFRSYRQELGQELIRLQGAVAILAATHPDLFQTEPFEGDVETSGALTTGYTVFDRRSHVRGRENLEVATKVDAESAVALVQAGLKRAGRQA